MSGHFLPNGKSFPVQAKPGSKEEAIEVVLPPGLAKKFVVEKKDFPAGLPPKWNDQKISWLNNFGLKAIKDTDSVPAKVAEKYEILVDAGAGATLVYYDEHDENEKVKTFSSDDHARPGNMPNKIAARLDLGDPPIGRT